MSNTAGNTATPGHEEAWVTCQDSREDKMGSTVVWEKRHTICIQRHATVTGDLCKMAVP